MSTKSNRACFSPDVNEKPTFFLKHGERSGRVLGNRKRIIGSWTFRLPKDPRFSPVKFLLRLGAKVARATVRVVSMRRRSSRKVSSSSTLVRSRSLSDPTDSHRAEAVEDCIEFLHSSSSRERPSR
ncbi:uncharacterized protein LOC129298296 [Prosopis cineraria]|uniref:uncharacterized protein LOC129288463 n=1 Tax=Prosopis cineraria TaxID=364024 RepID=UPI00240EEDBC|nr:uncharacterized protein LOC129288463 [Prosopis cineraria]XP_054792671.1 uncharacterized protein LOC129298296 [Prosopis cineraria]